MRQSLGAGAGRADHHSSPPRVQIVHPLLQHAGTYGAVTTLSRQLHVSRQSLYARRDRALIAWDRAFQVAPHPRQAAQRRRP